MSNLIDVVRDYLSNCPICGSLSDSGALATCMEYGHADLIQAAIEAEEGETALEMQLNLYKAETHELRELIAEALPGLQDKVDAFRRLSEEAQASQLALVEFINKCEQHDLSEDRS